MRIVLFTILISSVLVAEAQVIEAEEDLRKQSVDTVQGWQVTGNTGLTFSQVALKNWTAGGFNTFSVNGLLNLSVNYRKNNLLWENGLDVAYGVIRQGDEDALWIKSDDRIDFFSKLGHVIKNDFYGSVLYNFRTQFGPGYATSEQINKISQFAAPAYSLFAAGVDYSPSKNFSAFLAPVTLKTTIVADQTLANAGAFGVEEATFDDAGNLLTEGKQVRNEFGGYFKARIKRDIVKNVNFETKVDLFSNYLHNPQNIDVNWQVLIAMKVNKYITTTLSTHLIYDDDIDIAVDDNNDGVTDAIGPRIQFKEAFGLGFNFHF